jgi:hypothetical protein
MTVATYVSDLADLFLWENDTNVTDFGGGGQASSVGIEYTVEGTNAVAKPISNSERGFLHDDTSAFTIGANDHIYSWCLCSIPGLMATRDNRGLVMCVGDDTSNFVKFHLQGGDTLPFGGIQPYAVRFDNTTLTNFRTLVGTPGTSPSQIGVGSNITAVARFDNTAIDASRIGTGYDILHGTGADPEANFAGIGADDASTAEGVLVATEGGFLLQGKLRIGDSSNPCEFLDSNTSILIVDSIHSQTTFTEIIVEHASSILTLANVTFTGLGTNNPGRFEMITSAATVALTSCGFVDFGDTILGTGATLASCSWVGSAAVDALGASLSGSTIQIPNVSANTSGLIWNVNTDPDGKIDDMTFTKTSGVAHHAIEFGTAIADAADFTIRDCEFGTDFSGTEDGSVGDETFHFLDTTGSITLNLVGCGGNFGYRTEGVAVSIVTDPVTMTLTITDNASPPVVIEDARVFMEASDGTGPLPFNDSVAIVQTGGTATVTHAAHGLETNKYVVIRGAAENEYNKVAQVTVVDAGEYTYSVDSGVGSPATGSPVATGVIISGLSSVLGVIADTRTYSGNQPFKGWARKSSAQPFYSSGNLSGILSSVDGFTASISLLSDE